MPRHPTWGAGWRLRHPTWGTGWSPAVGVREPVGGFDIRLGEPAGGFDIRLGEPAGVPAGRDAGVGAAAPDGEPRGAPLARRPRRGGAPDPRQPARGARQGTPIRVKDGVRNGRRDVPAPPSTSAQSDILQLSLGMALDRAGRAREALVELEAALRLDPRSAQANYMIGTLLERAGGTRRRPDATPPPPSRPRSPSRRSFVWPTPTAGRRGRTRRCRTTGRSSP